MSDPVLDPWLGIQLIQLLGFALGITLALRSSGILNRESVFRIFLPATVAAFVFPFWVRFQLGVFVGEIHGSIISYGFLGVACLRALQYYQKELTAKFDEAMILVLVLNWNYLLYTSENGFVPFFQKISIPFSIYVFVMALTTFELSKGLRIFFVLGASLISAAMGIVQWFGFTNDPMNDAPVVRVLFSIFVAGTSLHFLSQTLLATSLVPIKRLNRESGKHMSQVNPSFALSRMNRKQAPFLFSVAVILLQGVPLFLNAHYKWFPEAFITSLNLTVAPIVTGLFMKRRVP